MDSPQYKIADHPILDKLLGEEDVQKLPWGVKWEMARVVNSRRQDESWLTTLYEIVALGGFKVPDESNPTASGIAELRDKTQEVSDIHDPRSDPGAGCEGQETGVSLYICFENVSHSLVYRDLGHCWTRREGLLPKSDSSVPNAGKSTSRHT
jgi:hypothetical protein